MIAVRYVSELYIKNRPIGNNFKSDPGQLFNDIDKLAFLLTPYCNIGCQHCGVGYHNYSTNGKLPLIGKDVLFGTIDLLPTVSSFTNIGGELMLLDGNALMYASKERVIGKTIANAFITTHYLPELVDLQRRKISGHKKIRMPTNGTLLPWDTDELTDILQKYRGCDFRISISPFHEMEFTRLAKRLGWDHTFKERIDTLIDAIGYTNQSLPSSETIGLGFLFTYLPRSGIYEDYESLDNLMSKMNEDIVAVPTQDPDSNGVIRHILENYPEMPIELQPVLAIERGARIPGAKMHFNEEPVRLSETRKLYCIPDADPKKMHFVNSPVKMYAGKDNDILFTLGWV